MCVICPATHLAPGVVEAESSPCPGILDVGRYPDGIDATVAEVAAALTTATFDSRVLADVMRWKYAKLLVNLGNAVEAICGPRCGTGELVELGASRGRGRAPAPPASPRCARGGCGPSRRPALAPYRRRAGAGRWVVVAEPDPWRRQHRGRLPERGDRAARPPPWCPHPGQRRRCSASPTGWRASGWHPARWERARFSPRSAGQGDLDRGADALGALRGDRTAVGLDEVTDDGEAQAGSGGARSLGEAIEDARAAGRQGSRCRRREP